MDTIFVKNVKDRSPAKLAGLQQGDRLIAVNGVAVNDKSYSQVVQLIVNSPEYLHLLVVPKEEDVLQRVSFTKLTVYHIYVFIFSFSLKLLIILLLISKSIPITPAISTRLRNFSLKG